MLYNVEKTLQMRWGVHIKRMFCCFPEQPWCPTSILSNWYHKISWGKAADAWNWSQI